jgi:hypothetical protein
MDKWFDPNRPGSFKVHMRNFAIPTLYQSITPLLNHSIDPAIH